VSGDTDDQRYARDECDALKFFRWLAKEIREVFPVTLFFFAGFGLVLLIVKRMLVRYAIPMTIFSRAIVAALIVGKVVLLLERVRLEDRFPNSPEWCWSRSRQAFHAFWAIVAGFLERIIEAWRATGEFATGVVSGMDAYGDPSVPRGRAARHDFVRNLFHISGNWTK